MMSAAITGSRDEGFRFTCLPYIAIAAREEHRYQHKEGKKRGEDFLHLPTDSVVQLARK